MRIKPKPRTVTLGGGDNVIIPEDWPRLLMGKMLLKVLSDDTGGELFHRIQSGGCAIDELRYILIARGLEVSKSTVARFIKRAKEREFDKHVSEFFAANPKLARNKLRSLDGGIIAPIRKK